jgi:hypothetical protein
MRWPAAWSCAPAARRGSRGPRCSKWASGSGSRQSSVATPRGRPAGEGARPPPPTVLPSDRPRVTISAPLAPRAGSGEERSSPEMGVFVPEREERTSVRTFVVVFGDERSIGHGKVPREERSSGSPLNWRPPALAPTARGAPRPAGPHADRDPGVRGRAADAGARGRGGRATRGGPLRHRPRDPRFRGSVAPPHLRCRRVCGRQDRDGLGVTPLRAVRPVARRPGGTGVPPNCAERAS